MRRCASRCGGKVDVDDHRKSKKYETFGWDGTVEMKGIVYAKKDLLSIAGVVMTEILNVRGSVNGRQSQIDGLIFFVSLVMTAINRGV